MAQVADLNAFSAWLNGPGYRPFTYAEARTVAVLIDQRTVRAAFEAAVRGSVYLIQRRLDDGYAYIAVKPAYGTAVPFEFRPKPVWHKKVY